MCPCWQPPSSRAPSSSAPIKNRSLSDLRESGSLEQDSDIVMFIHRPEVYEKDTLKQTAMAQIKISKHRNGPVGTVELVFRSNLAKFENAATAAPILLPMSA
jgi:replicative DNA helicase